MTRNSDRIWAGGSFQSTRAPLDPSLIELAVQSSGQSVKRVCVSHLYRLHSNLPEQELLSQICQDCPARSYLARQVQQRQQPGGDDGAKSAAAIVDPGQIASEATASAGG